MNTYERAQLREALSIAISPREKQQEKRDSIGNPRMESDLLAEAYLHLDMRRRMRLEAQEASKRSKVNAWPTRRRTA